MVRWEAVKYNGLFLAARKSHDLYPTGRKHDGLMFESSPAKNAVSGRTPQKTRSMAYGRGYAVAILGETDR